MSANKAIFSDEELRSYLNGDLEADIIERIDASLEQDDILVERLASLDEWYEIIPPAYELAGVTPSDTHLQSLMPQKGAKEHSDRIHRYRSARPSRGFSPSWRKLVYPSALAASLALAFMSGLGSASVIASLNSQHEALGETWRSTVASYAGLYTEQTFAGTLSFPEQRELMLQHVSHASGLPLMGLEHVDGLTLHGVQLLDFQGEALVKVDYVDENGQPLFFCILVKLNDDGNTLPPAPSQVAEMNGLMAVSWRTMPNDYLVIGDQSASDIMRYSNAIYENI